MRRGRRPPGATATLRASMRRTSIAMRRASVRNPPVTTTRCEAPTAGRRARSTTAALRRTGPRCSTRPAAVPGRAGAAAVRGRAGIVVGRGPAVAEDITVVEAVVVVAAGADRETDNMKNIRQTLGVLVAALVVCTTPVAF